MKKGNYYQAVTHYTKVINGGCTSHEIFYKRALANYSRKYYASAKDDCTKAISMRVNNEKAYFLRALCKIQLEDETALDDLKNGGEEGKMLLKELEAQIGTTASNSGKVVGGSGSGLIISKDGYIVTNEHVVSIGNYITITVKRNNVKKTYRAKVIKTDKINDLAICK